MRKYNDPYPIRIMDSLKEFITIANYRRKRWEDSTNLDEAGKSAFWGALMYRAGYFHTMPTDLVVLELVGAAVAVVAAAKAAWFCLCYWTTECRRSAVPFTPQINAVLAFMLMWAVLVSDQNLARDLAILGCFAAMAVAANTLGVFGWMCSLFRSPGQFEGDVA